MLMYCSAKFHNMLICSSVFFFEEKTIEWLEAVAMTQLWRNFIIDPLKALMFGKTLELLFGLLLGGCSIEEAALGVLQGELEAAGEGEIDIDVSIDAGGGADSFAYTPGDMADTPDTPDATATLVDANNDDTDGDENEDIDGGNQDNQQPNDNRDNSGMVLGAGVSTAMGAQTADAVLRSRADGRAECESSDAELPTARRP